MFIPNSPATHALIRILARDLARRLYENPKH
jgi:hypothetical protein